MLASAGRGDERCWPCPTEECRECACDRHASDRRPGGGGGCPKRQRQDGKITVGGLTRGWKSRVGRTGFQCATYRRNSDSSKRRGRGAIGGASSAVVRLRGGDASPASPSSPSNTKVDIKEEAPWGLNLKKFGWGGEESEAKAEEKRKAQKGVDEARAKDVMRKAREERFETANENAVSCV